ncbi:MAG: amidase family protein, partial [Bacteroidales bacterium]|nr:amidase family protein [Bacteroidales bacterium]
METYTIEQLAAKIKNNEIDLKQYYEELFEEVAIQQKRLNCMVTITKEEAFKALENDSGSLLNKIPGVLKDNYNTKGILTTASSRMLEDYVPVYSAAVYESLEKANIALIGKASMDELAMGGTNKSALTGPVLNPWDTSRISGGSSGGSAACVASGLVPFAMGSDTGDSVRKPAGLCGVYGFKPTWGRISRYGIIPYASSLDAVGIFTRNVRDMAIVTRELAGRDNRDMTSSFKEVPDYLADLNPDLANRTIAVLTTVSDEVRNEKIKANFDEMVAKFRELGAKVIEVTMDQELARAILPVYKIIANSEATSNHACLDGIKYGNRQPGDSVDEIMINSRTNGFGDHIKRRFILGNLALATENQEKMFRQAQRVRRLIVQQMDEIFKKADVIIAPNSGQIAPKVAEASDDMLSDEYIILENYLALANFGGNPSLTMPVGMVEGMPIGLNITGRIFEEQTVLDVAYALEQVLDFKDRYKRED